MRELGKIAALAVGFGLLAVALSFAPGQSARAGGSAPVIVTNTPLPVQGTVNAAQSGAWNVGITGTPSVSISGTPNVQLANSTETLGRPFAEDLSILDNQVHDITNFTVSQGEIWMIEFVSGDCGLKGGTSAPTYVDAINVGLPLNGGGTGGQVIPFSTEQSAAAGATAHFAWAQQVRLYTDSTNDIPKYVQIYGSTGDGGGLICQVHLTGRLISTE